jgi:eukaryotic-like serine/threonine-protein kinase
MGLSSGTRLGPYEILSKIGSGGMGEVYRAKDTRLDRTVAIKVLPSHLSADPHFKQRFEREARTISSLSHPYICALYDVGHQEGIDFLVMEFLEGETLAGRLSKSALPLDQVLRYGIQIADALDKAHKQGIVHRDLKPGNIMITKSGVKLLDFGLAKLQAPLTQHVLSGVSALPTEQRELTAEGTILGTIQYMSPEQLEGKETDARTDIFAMGTVLYEMATARKAFTGKSQASLIAAILSSEPQPISTIQPLAPPALDRVVKNCLAKEPDDRWQTAHDVMLELKWIAEGGSQAGIPARVLTRRKGQERITSILAIIFAITTLALALSLFRLKRSDQAGNVLHAFLSPPKNTSFQLLGDGGFALSPDGKTLAFVATQEGKKLLWVQALAENEARPLPGTDGASWPFWSPDSRFLGFFSDEKLKKIDTSGGLPVTICDASEEPRGGTWNKEGIIAFSASRTSPLSKVSASGGTPIEFTKLDQLRRDTTHRWPQFLPDGKHALYLASPNTGESQEDAVFIASLDGRENRLILKDSSDALYASGHLLYVHKNSFMAQPFDPEQAQITGDAFPVGENIMFDWQTRREVLSASQNGILAYQSVPQLANSQLVWFDRTGKTAGTFNAAEYFNPRISPDGKKVALSLGVPGKSSIWVFDALTQTKLRLTFGSNYSCCPVWSPDGNRIAYCAVVKKFADVYQKSSSGTGGEEILSQTDFSKNPSDWSHDGKYIAFLRWDPAGGTKYDIWILPLAGDRKPFPLLKTKYDEMDARFSPDGKWIAYNSNESGRNEVYVQSFPEQGSKWQISSAGGMKPTWRRDGKELFFLSPNKSVMAVDIQSSSGFASGSPRELFKLQIQSYFEIEYDISPDGQRFLVRSDVPEATFSMITLFVNWASKLKP